MATKFCPACSRETEHSGPADYCDICGRTESAAHTYLRSLSSNQTSIREATASSKYSWYSIGFYITAAITFIGAWIYCIASYGFLLGVGLGWLPAAITAYVVGLCWPLIAITVVVIGFLVLAK